MLVTTLLQKQTQGCFLFRLEVGVIVFYVQAASGTGMSWHHMLLIW